LQLEFRQNLRSLMLKRFAGHWHPERPDRGSGYRAILSDNVQVDSILLEALAMCEPWLERHRPSAKHSVNPHALARHLPHNVVMQCNPNRCCVRKLDGSWQVSNVFLRNSGSKTASATTPLSASESLSSAQSFAVVSRGSPSIAAAGSGAVAAAAERSASSSKQSRQTSA
jgi:BTG family